MLQSQQCWLPILRNPTPFVESVSNGHCWDTRFIAHCLEAPRPTASLPALLRQSNPSTGTPATPGRSASSIILIGPEGDFSPNEVEMALKDRFIPVTLGDNRLRTETAGVVAATLLCIG
jgi:16S rRNA (uracil1498-N3)-methyltransferase